MKRNDIQLGQDYVVSGRQDWQRSIYNNMHHRVISLGNWHPSQSRFSRSEATLTYDGQEFTVWRATEYPRLTHGLPIGRAHVVVAPVNEDGTLHPKAEAVPASHVRCTWEEGQEISREVREAADRHRAQREEAEQRRLARIAAATDARSRIQAFVEERERNTYIPDIIRIDNGFALRLSDIKTLLQG